MRLILLMTLLCLAALSLGTSVPAQESKASKELFPAPPIVKQQTDFWIKVFERYKSSAIIIHDPEFVDIIIDVIDFDAFRQKYNDGRAFTRQERKEILNRYVDRYQLAINRLQKVGRKALEFGPMEQRVLQVYSRRKETLSRLFTEEIYLRTQQGLADEFPRATERASAYFPYMERIFRNRGMPTELTRIVFVESMFNKEALSKVGATGVWQFMPDTARHFMTVNHYIDERRSPLKASYGAAKMLDQNLRLLKNWPLAITAYNHGPGGMQRAVRTLGTRDIDEIIRRYQSPTFGFASRNFYAEFLAAKHVYGSVSQQTVAKRALKIDHIRLDRPVTVHQLITQTPLQRDVLEQYNLCLLPKAFQSHKHQPLPVGFEIIVPQEMSGSVRQAIRRLQISNAPKPKVRS